MPVTATELHQIIADIWQAVLGVEVTLGPVGQPMGPGTIAARVRISGPWVGTLILRATREGAAWSASVMFNRGILETSSDDVRDALGELANMIAGNVKGLLAGDSKVGLPVVGEWRGGEAPRSGTLISQLRLECGGHSFQGILLALEAFEGGEQ